MKKNLFTRSKILRLFFLTATLLISNQSLAAVVYLNDNRRVEIDGSDGIDSYSSVVRPTTDFADFDHIAQTSALTSNGFTAYGSGDAYSDYGWSSTWSFFDISFNLTTESTVAISGSLYGYDEFSGSGDASIMFYSGTSLLAENLLYSDSVAAYYGSEQSILSFNSVLAAGEYRIIVKADPYFQIAQSYYNVNAEFTPSAVPLPPSIWLFLAGLASLITVKKRKL